MLYKDTVTEELLRAARELSAIADLQSFRMVGGTAIALQLGHRKSVDIDFFSNEKLSTGSIQKLIKNHFETKEINVTWDHLWFFWNEIRIELYPDWPVPFLHQSVTEDGLRLASLPDLAAQKLNAIVGRREKKDYIDLYFLFEHLGMQDILTGFRKYDPLISAKSLVFALSEVKVAITNQSVMPEMIKSFSWEEVVKYMIEASRFIRRMK